MMAQHFGIQSNCCVAATRNISIASRVYSGRQEKLALDGATFAGSGCGISMLTRQAYASNLTCFFGGPF
jgi:hypothetical protein